MIVAKKNSVIVSHAMARFIFVLLIPSAARRPLANAIPDSVLGAIGK